MPSGDLKLAYREMRVTRSLISSPPLFTYRARMLSGCQIILLEWAKYASRHSVLDLCTIFEFIVTVSRIEGLK